MDTDQTIRVASGRTVGFADYGSSRDTAVIWCHGGPGSRLAPAYMAGAAGAAGLRLVGIDRPGYGLSTVEPGRTIGGWVPEALAVADHLGIDRFVTVGTSTGRAFALAVAALAPERVLGVVACCAMTDMRWEPARATMSRPHGRAVWDAPDRASAMAAAVESHGLDGSKIIESAEGPPLAPSDLAMIAGHPWGRHWLAAVPAMFAQGLAGYTDVRLADGPGWVTFDVADITSPVIVPPRRTRRHLRIHPRPSHRRDRPPRRATHHRRPRPPQHRRPDRAHDRRPPPHEPPEARAGREVAGASKTRRTTTRASSAGPLRSTAQATRPCADMSADRLLSSSLRASSEASGTERLPSRSTSWSIAGPEDSSQRARTIIRAHQSLVHRDVSHNGVSEDRVLASPNAGSGTTLCARCRMREASASA